MIRATRNLPRQVSVNLLEDPLKPESRLKAALAFTRAVVSILAALLFAAPACRSRPKDDAIPIRVAPGESVTLERAPAKGNDVFALTATAGQTLRLEVDAKCPGCEQWDSATVDGLRVFPADTTRPADLPTPKGSEDCQRWRWMNVLPSSGVYRIVVNRRAEKRYRLRVSLLDPHDPLFDPGITADRVSIGEGLFPTGGKLTLKTYEPFIDYCNVPGFDTNLPAHLRFEEKDRWLGIMSLEGLKEAGPWWVGDVAEVERDTRPGVKPVKPPFSGFDDSRLMHWGRLERFNGKSWRGLRWIAQYSQEGDGELQNPLMYDFAAISKDGKYFIWFWVDIEYLNPPRELFKLTDEQNGRLWEDRKASEVFQQKVNVALTGASPTSFKPDLNQLDAAVHSLELR